MFYTSIPSLRGDRKNMSPDPGFARNWNHWESELLLNQSYATVPGIPCFPQVIWRRRRRTVSGRIILHKTWLTRLSSSRKDYRDESFQQATATHLTRCVVPILSRISISCHRDLGRWRTQCALLGDAGRGKCGPHGEGCFTRLNHRSHVMLEQCLTSQVEEREGKGKNPRQQSRCVVEKLLQWSWVSRVQSIRRFSRILLGFLFFSEGCFCSWLGTFLEMTRGSVCIAYLFKQGTTCPSSFTLTTLL